MTKPTKKLIVVGHGRGGTSFASTWLNENGIMVAHEMMGRDGIVDSMLSVPTGFIRTGTSIGASRDEFEFEHKICIVRDPWKTIATYFAVEGEGSIWNHGNYIDLSDANGDELSAIAISVVDWTKAGLEYTGYRFLQAEQWNAQAPFMLQSLGFESRQWRDIPANKINHQPGNRISADEIRGRISPSLAQSVASWRSELGYA